MEARWVQIDPTHRRHGFVVGIARESGVTRAALNGWFQRSSVPRLDALGEVAKVLQVNRAQLVAVFDGTTSAVSDEDLEILTDAERKRRRSWWLRVARETTPLLLGPANAALSAAGFRSERGELVSIWEDPRGRLEPNAAQIRALAEIYRIPVREFVDLWNNPPATDEETMAERRGVRIEEVRSEPEAEPTKRERRRTA
jgi:transcriptional regulator with XRE-family HTH domain